MKIRERGSAIIITLLLICLITILVIGFLSSMQMESSMARSHLNGINAEFISQMGTDAAMARLQTAIGNTTNSYWTTQPGAVAVAGSSVDISSGFSSSTNSTNTVDLNVQDLEDSTKYAIAFSNNFVNPSAPQMRVQWIYVENNGSFTNASSTNSIGRFAFWTDDESAKVNINTAWQNGSANTNSLSNPSQVGLATLGFPSASSVQTNGPFNTVQEVCRVTNAAPVIATNSFSMSAYNHSPDLNMFNTPRIILTTQTNLAPGSTNFLDILTTPNTDPGSVANLSATKVQNQVNRLTAILQQTNWPFPSLPGQSFASKYSPVRPQQLAVDIIEYVRARESTNTVVEPIFGYLSGSSFIYDAAASLSDPSELEGNTRAPRVTEMGIYTSTPFTNGSPPSSVVLAQFYMEVYLPPFFGLSQLDLTQYKLSAAINLTNGSYYAFSGPILTNQSVINTNSLTPLSVPTSPTTPSVFTNIVVYNDGSANYWDLMAGGYRKIIGACLFTSTNRNAVAVSGFRGALRDANSVRVEIASTSGSQSIAYTLDGPLVASNAITTAQVKDDPSLNTCPTNWTQTTSTWETNPVTSTLGQPASSSISPQQDTDSAGNLTNIGMQFPAPKGSLGNLSGIMQSPAELGYIHTGVEATTNGVSWRTLRLQPQRTTTNLPDWALVDMLSVPVSTNSFFDNPTATNSSYLTPGGKVNLNAQIRPFVDTSSNPVIIRLLPLTAVFNGATNGTTVLSSTAAGTLATNIYNQTLASNGNFYGLSNYISPGQVVEIQGVADAGEASETLPLNTLGLLTTRSGVFSIYSVGQSIQQSASGTITVLGEHRDLTIVEQVQSSGTTLIFRPVFSKQISP